VRLEDALELEEGLVVEGDVRHVGHPDARLPQACAHRVDRKGLVVALSREALLLGGGHDAPVVQQAGGRVVVIGGDTQDEHLERARQ